MAVANRGDVSILLGDGHGGFGEVANYSAGSYSDSIAAADFNGDGNLDLAVTNSAHVNNLCMLNFGDDLPYNPATGRTRKRYVG